jgi:hypothetical protein
MGARARGERRSQVPTVQEDARRDFAEFVPNMPQSDYSWRFFGRASIYTPGAYTFCTTSDDGSLFYLALAPAPPGAAGGAEYVPGVPAGGYSMVVDNDGVHGPSQACRTLKLAAGDYPTKVRPCPARGGD